MKNQLNLTVYILKIVNNFLYLISFFIITLFIMAHVNVLKQVIREITNNCLS